MFSSQRLRFPPSLDLEDGGAMKSSLHKPDTAGSRNLRNVIVVVLVVLALFFFVPGAGLSLSGSVRFALYFLRNARAARCFSRTHLFPAHTHVHARTEPPR